MLVLYLCHCEEDDELHVAVHDCSPNTEACKGGLHCVDPDSKETSSTILIITSGRAGAVTQLAECFLAGCFQIYLYLSINSIFLRSEFSV